MSRPGAKFFMLRNRGIVDPADGGQIIDSTGATFNRGDFTSGNAFFWSSIDLGWYAGAYPGSTPFYIELLDAAGKKATGYIGAVGAGETLSELLTNPTFDVNTDGWMPQSGTLASIVGGQSNNCLEITRVSGNYQYVSQTANLTSGWLIKVSGYIKSGTSGNEAYQFGPFQLLGGYLSGTSSGSWTQVSIYKSCITTQANTFYVIKSTATPGTMLFDEMNLKRVTDPPSTAVHIVSSLNGITRNWASIESGFDPNTITSWIIKEY